MAKTVQRVCAGALVLCTLIIVASSQSKNIEAKQERSQEEVQRFRVSNLPKTLIHNQVRYKIEVQESVVNEDEANKSKQEKKMVEKSDYDSEELYWLSRIVSAEAKGESKEGQIAVANVVLNRTKSKGFPDTVKGVIFQKKQFSPVSNKSIYDTPTDDAIEAAKQALEGETVVDENVLYFYNPKTATSRWLDSREVAADIGNHRFTY